MTNLARSVLRSRNDLGFYQLSNQPSLFKTWFSFPLRSPLILIALNNTMVKIFFLSILFFFRKIKTERKNYEMSEIDYSIEYHHINCEEYFWHNTDQRLYPAVIFLANTRDDQRTDENVNTLSQIRD